MVSVNELKEFPLLEGLSPSELEALAAAMERREVKKGTCIIRAEDPGQFLMFVASGRVAVELAGEDGRQVAIDMLGPGSFFGELSLLTGEPRSADVQACSPCTLFVLSQHDFERHLMTSHGLTRALLRELAFRLRATAAKVGDLVLLDVYRRIARVLASLAKEKKREGETVRVIDTRPTHKELAALAGTTREMATRALKELEEAEHIQIEGKRITILSLPL